jgi:hypothetical protein
MSSSPRFLSLEDYNLVAHFERLRKRLCEVTNDERLDKPLAYWALASDRRLPFAFLGRTLRDLFSTPFDELLATPGIGQKKISSLITLLSRAASDTRLEGTTSADSSDQAIRQGPATSVASPFSPGVPFNPGLVSESLWVQWRETVKRHRLGHLKLGRLTPTLQSLPTVIWHTPLAEYLDLSLTEIRHLKTHGEKRIRAILEVFWLIHEALADASIKDHLDVQLAPKFVRRIEGWIAAAMGGPEAPVERQIQAHLAEPLLAQIEVDAGPTVWRIATDRLGLKGPAKSVRQIAKKMSLTRARVYQLLEECAKVMDVRWPEGEHFLAALGERLRQGGASDDALQRFDSLMALFYPKSPVVARHMADRVRSGISPLATPTT